MCPRERASLPLLMGKPALCFWGERGKLWPSGAQDLLLFGFMDSKCVREVHPARAMAAL